MTERSDRHEWLDWRREGIGASDVAAICGLSPWASPMSVYLEKTGQIPGTEETEAMRWGLLLEGAIADEFTRRTGLYVTGEQTWCEHPDASHHRATVDGFIVASTGDGVTDASGLLEIKTTGVRSWDEIPDQVWCQAQWQMHVTGLPKVWLAVLHAGQRLSIHELDADPAGQADLAQIADEFWRRVLDANPPPVDSSKTTADALARAYARTDPDLIVHLDAAAELIAARADAKAAVGEAETLLRGVENRIKALMGHTELGLIDGCRAVVWTPVIRRTIDTTRLKEENPEIADRYMKESTYRRLTFPGGDK